MQYVGQTSRFLKTRFTEHYCLMKMPRKIGNFLYKYFEVTNHSPYHILIQLVDFYINIILLKDIVIFSGMN